MILKFQLDISWDGSFIVMIMMSTWSVPLKTQECLHWSCLLLFSPFWAIYSTLACQLSIECTALSCSVLPRAINLKPRVSWLRQRRLKFSTAGPPPFTRHGFLPYTANLPPKMCWNTNTSFTGYCYLSLLLPLPLCDVWKKCSEIIRICIFISLAGAL